MSRRKAPLFLIVGAFCFFTVLMLCGFPEPHYDDLFYSGAALNRAHGGDFSNPLLARQEFPGHFFFEYPPVQSYLLAGWLKMFGIGTCQILAFMGLTYFLIAMAMIFILRRRHSPAWMQWIVPLAVAYVFLPLGLRPESLATALALAGYAIAIGKPEAPAATFGGGFLILLGGACAPRVLFFAGALLLHAAWIINGGLGSRGVKSLKLLACFAAASLLVMLLFLLMIHFRVSEFLAAFNLHGSRVAGKPLVLLKDYVTHTLGILQWPLVLLPVGLMAYSVCKGTAEVRALALLFGGALLATAWKGGIGLGSFWWFIFLMLVLAGSFIESQGKRNAILLQVMLALSLLIAERKLLVNWYGRLSGNISMIQGDNWKTARELRPTPDHPLLLDGAAARYIFDYRLPEGSLDLEFGSRFPGSLPGALSSDELRPGDIYMAGPDTIIFLEHATFLDITQAGWSWLGLSSFQYEKYPRLIHVFPVEQCRDHRPTGDDNVWLPVTPRRP